MKHFDEINSTVEVRQPMSLRERAELAIRTIQRRINNPEMAEDCRRIARQELKHWRGILIKNML